MRLFSHPSEIVLATTDFVNEGLNHPRKDDIIDFARGKLLIDVLGKQYSAEVVIGFTKKGICELHDVLKLTPTKFKYKTRDALSTISHNDEHLQKRSSLATNSISNPDENVKRDDDIVFSASSNKDGDNGGSDVVTTEDEFLARMLYYRDNPEAAAQAKADYVIQNAELEAKGKTNFIYGAINTQPRIAKKRFVDEVSKSWQFVMRKMVDSGDAVTRIGKEIKDSRLYAYYNMARASTNAAAYMITDAQTDITGKKVGDGLNKIFEPIKAKGDEYYHEFQKYLYHLHNIDRMSRQNGDRAEYARNEFEAFRVEHSELLKYTDSEIERMIYAIA